MGAEMMDGMWDKGGKEREKKMAMKKICGGNGSVEMMGARKVWKVRKMREKEGEKKRGKDEGERKAREG